jgi:hypothetical protein
LTSLHNQMRNGDNHGSISARNVSIRIIIVCNELPQLWGNTRSSKANMNRRLTSLQSQTLDLDHTDTTIGVLPDRFDPSLLRQASLANRDYWLDLFTGTTWKDFHVDAGAQVSGFRDSRWKTVQQIRPGDYLLCHLTRVDRIAQIDRLTRHLSPEFLVELSESCEITEP